MKKAVKWMLIAAGIMICAGTALCGAGILAAGGMEELKNAVNGTFYFIEEDVWHLQFPYPDDMECNVKNITIKF